MALMAWNENFATGIAVIDAQHRWLVDLVNGAAPALALDYRRVHESADRLIDQLLDYASFHFATEDGVMRDYGIDPHHRQLHSESHGKFAADVAAMRDAYAGGATATGGELLGFLANWLIFHILGEDQALARQVRAIESGLTPERAFVVAEGNRCDPSPTALARAMVDLYTLMTEQNRRLADTNRHLDDMVRARTTELLHALDVAETSMKARNSFIANMSHEIRTPMNAIIGITWALRQHTADPTQLARLHQVSEATQQLLAVINGLLDMARLESEQLQLEPRDFSPAQLIDDLLAEYGKIAESRSLTLRPELHDLPLTMHGDPVRLRQILGNFLDNALKFTPDGGVVLRSRRLPETARAGLRFEIEDSGPGLASDLLPRLFNPFEQQDATSTRTHRGAGLGLAICKRLAELMGGRVGGENVPAGTGDDRRGGAIFWLEIPCLACAGPEDDGPQAASPDAGYAHRRDAAAVRAAHRDTVAKLGALLAEDDVQAISLWNTSATVLRDLFDGHAAPFEAALAAFDFAAADALLRETLAGLDDPDRPDRQDHPDHAGAPR